MADSPRLEIGDRVRFLVVPPHVWAKKWPGTVMGYERDEEGRWVYFAEAYHQSAKTSEENLESWPPGLHLGNII